MSGVRPEEPIVLHRYLDGKILCGGQWYPNGESPCEILSEAHHVALRSLPPCEQADIDAAALLLLGLPKGSRCWTRNRDSQSDREAELLAILNGTAASSSASPSGVALQRIIEQARRA